MSVGGLLGALAAPWLQARTTLRILVIAVLWAVAVSLASASLLSPRLLTVAPLAIGIFLTPAANASLFGRLAATTPEQLQGRVISVVFFAATGTASLIGCAVATTVSAVVASLSKELGDSPPKSVTP